MSVVRAPAPVSANPLRRVSSDIVAELRAGGGFPPGLTDFSLARTARMMEDPLSVLLPCYERFGPIFSLRLFHERIVIMLGPAANHFILVSDAPTFSWRYGDYLQLIPLLGDGLLTIDGDYHRRARRIMLPAFHHESVAASLGTMIAEAEAAIGELRERERIDVYSWARELAMRIAMRALLGLDPDDGDQGVRAARHFEAALAYYQTNPIARFRRGPRSAFGRMQASRRVLDEIIYAEIARRRRGGTAPDASLSGRDILSMLIDARDEDGSRLSDAEVRHQAITLMFAGHDTSTSTIAFMLYELARHPDALARIVDEQDRVLGGAPPTAEQLVRGLPELDMALDETLRLYPPAWVGPRRAVAPFDFNGHHVPAGTYIAYSSWASHRLPDVFPDPERFDPHRFSPERRAALPKGAYIPFGGGSRTCIGMRFGQMEIKAVMTLILQRLRPERVPGHVMRVRHSPTLGPAGGLPLTLQPREAP